MRIFHVTALCLAVTLSSPLQAQELSGEIAKEIDTALQLEKRRLVRMVQLAPMSVSDLKSLSVGDVQELKCHTTQNGKWIKCDWPYAPNLCSNIGWVPHTDGSCCLGID